MRILYYSPHPDLFLESNSGYGTHMREMISAFRESGHSVDTLIMGSQKSNTNSDNNEFRLKNVLKTMIPGMVWESLKHYNIIRSDKKNEHKIGEILSKKSYDFIYERSSYLQTSGVTVANSLKIPHVLEVNAPAGVEKKYKGFPPSLFDKTGIRKEKTQLQMSNCIASVSTALTEYFVKKYDLPEDKFIFTPNGINLSGIKVNHDKVNNIKKKYQLQNQVVIGFIGSIIKWQRVDLLIHALKHVCNIKNDVKLMIVGDSQLLDEYKLLAGKLEVSAHVIFTGKIPHEDIYNYIQAMDITVLPDNMWYGSPTKLFEYGALGKPTIAPNNVTISKIIQHNRDGILIESDSKSIANALIRLINNNQLRVSMGNSFKERIFKEFTWENNVNKVIDAVHNSVA